MGEGGHSTKKKKYFQRRGKNLREGKGEKKESLLSLVQQKRMRIGGLGNFSERNFGNQKGFWRERKPGETQRRGSRGVFTAGLGGEGTIMSRGGKKGKMGGGDRRRSVKIVHRTVLHL